MEDSGKDVIWFCGDGREFRSNFWDADISSQDKALVFCLGNAVNPVRAAYPGGCVIPVFWLNRLLRQGMVGGNRLIIFDKEGTI